MQESMHDSNSQLNERKSRRAQRPLGHSPNALVIPAKGLLGELAPPNTAA